MVVSAKPLTPLSTRSKRNSSRWKEQVREACLRRALQIRHQKQRLQQQQQFSTPAKPQHEGQQQQLSAEDDEMQHEVAQQSTPRSFLEDELRQLGVNVESPLNPHPPPIDDVDMKEIQNDEDGCPYNMTEDEFIELLEEIESDLEIKLLEDQLELEEGIFQDQVASFENDLDFNDLPQQLEEQFVEIVCPLCQFGTLQSERKADGSMEIFCSRTVRMSKPCSFHLQAGVTTLQRLHERMQVSQTTHTDFCSAMDSCLVYCNPDPLTLTASCKSCESIMRIYG